MKHLFVIATGSAGKIRDFAHILGTDHYEFQTLKDIGFDGDIVEDGKTFAEGSTTEGSWDTPVNSHDVPTGIKVGANSCNGEILIVKGRLTQTGKRCHVALQSLPKADTRADVSIFYKVLEEGKKYTSAEFAEDWKLGLQVTKKRSAYSTMCLQKDGRIAFFYEEEPYIFNMVYVPLTLSQATNGDVK